MNESQEILNDQEVDIDSQDASAVVPDQSVIDEALVVKGHQMLSNDESENEAVTVPDVSDVLDHAEETEAPIDEVVPESPAKSVSAEYVIVERELVSENDATVAPVVQEEMPTTEQEEDLVVESQEVPLHVAVEEVEAPAIEELAAEEPVAVQEEVLEEVKPLESLNDDPSAELAQSEEVTEEVAAAEPVDEEPAPVQESTDASPVIETAELSTEEAPKTSPVPPDLIQSSKEIASNIGLDVEVPTTVVPGPMSPSASMSNLAPSLRTASDGPPVAISAVTAAVRAVNPVLDELLHSLALLSANDASLAQLDLKDCPIFQLSHGTSLANGLIGNTHLEALYLQNTKLQTSTAIEIAQVCFNKGIVF